MFNSPIIHYQPQTQTAIVTAYTCGYESTGKRKGDKGYCLTASGYKLTPDDSYKIAAADPRYYHFGQRIYLEGIGEVTVEDTGSDIKGKNRFDIFINDVKEAKKFGIKKLRLD